MAVTSTVVNLPLKPLGRSPATPRRPPRPDQPPRDHASHRLVPVGPRGLRVRLRHRRATAWPEARLPLSAAATLVGYSGVHTGVHYPVDVIAGSLTGTMLAQLTAAALGRRRGRVASGLNATAMTTPRRTGRSGSAAGAGVSPWPCLCAPLPSSRISPHRRTVVTARDGLASDDRPWSQPSNVSSPRRRRTASSNHDH
jgi:hypothetical protein